jgi:hypothetical protein
MIMIEVDEAYAFDMLAILQIKASKSDANLNNYTIFLTGIYDELPNNIVNAVLASKEYAALVEVNQAVFDLIEKVVSEQEYAIPDDWTTAIDVHNANMSRYYTKKALQEKFFEENLTELKTVR